MKKYLVLLLIILSSCSDLVFLKKETVEVDVYITDVFKAKYSKVRGHFYYNNICITVHNGITGYYYKNYNLKPGDIIKQKVTVLQYRSLKNDDIHLRTSNISVNEYEIK